MPLVLLLIKDVCDGGDPRLWILQNANQFVLAFFTVIKYLSLLFYFVWTVCSLNFKPIQYVMTQKVSRPCLILVFQLVVSLVFFS